jgi:hypothetical protein
MDTDWALVEWLSPLTEIVPNTMSVPAPVASRLSLVKSLDKPVKVTVAEPSGVVVGVTDVLN